MFVLFRFNYRICARFGPGLFAEFLNYLIVCNTAPLCGYLCHKCLPEGICHILGRDGTFGIFFGLVIYVYASGLVLRAFVNLSVSP